MNAVIHLAPCRCSRALLLCCIVAGILCACARQDRSDDLFVLRQQVTDAERAFAQSMADRDHAAFAALLSEDAVFFSGEQPVRGKQAVAAAWKPFFEGLIPPFSWEPDRVEVLESGSLALSTGPVRDPEGEVIARFNSIWREEAPGMWRVVFDKGSPVCGPSAADR
jgi:ketosteroid isomerase-like protein